MQIFVKLGEPLWRTAGARRLTLEWPDGARVTLRDALARLAAEHPDFAAAYSGQGLKRAYPYRVFVDAVPLDPAPGLDCISDEGLSGPALAPGQTIFILLPAIGGWVEPD